VTDGLVEVFAADHSAIPYTLWDQAAVPNPRHVVIDPDDRTYLPRQVSLSEPRLKYHEAVLSMRSLLLRPGRDEFLRRVGQLIDGQARWKDNLQTAPVSPLFNNPKSAACRGVGELGCRMPSMIVSVSCKEEAP